MKRKRWFWIIYATCSITFFIVPPMNGNLNLFAEKWDKVQFQTSYKCKVYEEKIASFDLCDYSVIVDESGKVTVK